MTGPQRPAEAIERGTMRNLIFAALIALGPIASAAAEPPCPVTYEIARDAAPVFWGVHRGCLVIIWAEWADG